MAGIDANDSVPRKEMKHVRIDLPAAMAAAFRECAAMDKDKSGVLAVVHTLVRSRSEQIELLALMRPIADV